jgi:hypothetical protein
MIRSMRGAQSLAQALALASVFALGCGGGSARVSRPESLYAYWSVEEVDVHRGDIRVAGPAEIDPEAADVDIVDRCDRRSLGGGVWTRNRLVWRLSARDIATGFACASEVGLRATRAGAEPGAIPRFSVSLRLDVSLDSETSTGLEGLDVAFDGDQSVVQAKSANAPGLKLALGGRGVMGPDIAFEDVAAFRMPTEALIDAAIRQAPVRVFGGGADAYVWPKLYVQDRLAIAEDPSPASSENE